ncbi:MAG: hypothetical protein ACR2ND_06400 [Solirubrobacteraceae bacterium]
MLVVVTWTLPAMVLKLLLPVRARIAPFFPHVAQLLNGVAVGGVPVGPQDRMPPEPLPRLPDATCTFAMRAVPSSVICH